jgi:hypothetical protein
MSDRALTVTLADGPHVLRPPAYYGLLLMKRSAKAVGIDFNPFDQSALDFTVRDESGAPVMAPAPKLDADGNPVIRKGEVVMEDQPVVDLDRFSEVIPIMLAALMTMGEGNDPVSKKPAKTWEPDEVALLMDPEGINEVMEACMTLIGIAAPESSPEATTPQDHLATGGVQRKKSTGSKKPQP